MTLDNNQIQAMGGPADIKGYYETLVTNYDLLSSKVVMENVTLQQMIVDALPFPNTAPIRILDIGIGTAVTARKILDRFPQAHLTGVDFSDEMMRAAANTLSLYADRFTLIQADVGEANAVFSGNRYDAIVSAVTIHNMPNEAKSRLFAAISASLNSGGVFINGDFIRGETEQEEIETRGIYKNFLETNLTGAELKTWLHHAFEFDMPMKLSEQQSRLSQLGLTDFKVLWRHPREAVYIARR
jgi:tRNA (cmo5U34)-methyltransferase